MARCRPTTRDELLAVKGMGPVKVERYGHTLLEIIAEAATEETETGRGGNDEQPDHFRHPSLSVSPSPPLPLSDSHWTRRLLAAGFTVDECMAIRGLTREVVLEHARQTEGDLEGGTP